MTIPVTTIELLPVLAELRQLEPIFHVAAFGNTRADYEKFMDADYWEVGASGTRYSRQDILDVLEQRGGVIIEPSWQTTDFVCRAMGPDTYLLTYTLFQGTRVTRRTTVWRKTADEWKILYHQGTIVQWP
jgi:hypothetical protein